MDDAWCHRLAVLTAAATVFLLFVGALVTSKGVGMAVPDWPTTFGYPMFLFPWSGMVGGVFYEHGHRLVASGVGALTVILAGCLWFKERRAVLRWLGVAALVLVIVQGVIGGLRVLFVEQAFAIVHAALAQAYFALIVSIALMTSRSWREGLGQPLAIPSGFAWLCGVTTALVYVQALVGAFIRHTGFGVVLHVLVASLIALQVFLIVKRMGGGTLGNAFERPALLLGGLVTLQVALGLGSYLGRFSALAPAMPRTWTVLVTAIHVVTGALVLAMSLLLTLRSVRLAQAASERQTILTERISA